MWTQAREAAVLAVTCKFLRMVGVGKVMLEGAGVSEEDDSVSGSSRCIWWSHVTSTAASSSLLGVPWCLRARAIQMISLISPTYVLPRSTLLRTLVMAARRAWLVAALSVKGMAAWVLPSEVRMVGPLRETACMGGATFSWSESLSSLGVGSSGCGKLLSLMRMKVAGVAFCMHN